jgi:hypothetical protein
LAAKQHRARSIGLEWIMACPVPGERRPLTRIGVDHTRFAFADSDALGHWEHDDSLDGLADVVFWGEDEVAAEFGARRTR